MEHREAVPGTFPPVTPTRAWAGPCNTSLWASLSCRPPTQALKTVLVKLERRVTRLGWPGSSS